MKKENWDAITKLLDKNIRESPYFPIFYASVLISSLSIIYGREFSFSARLLIYSFSGLIWRHLIRDIRGMYRKLKKYEVANNFTLIYHLGNGLLFLVWLYTMAQMPIEIPELSNFLVFVIYEGILVTLTFYAILQEILYRIKKPYNSVQNTVIRGAESINFFQFFFTMAFTYISVELVRNTEETVGLENLLLIFNFSIIGYLSYFNSWFKNKLVGILNAIKTEEH